VKDFQSKGIDVESIRIDDEFLNKPPHGTVPFVKFTEIRLSGEAVSGLQQQQQQQQTTKKSTSSSAIWVVASHS